MSVLCSHILQLVTGDLSSHTGFKTKKGRCERVVPSLPMGNLLFCDGISEICAWQTDDFCCAKCKYIPLAVGKEVKCESCVPPITDREMNQCKPWHEHQALLTKL